MKGSVIPIVDFTTCGRCGVDVVDIYVINMYLPQISCVRQLIKPNIVYKDTMGMTNHMIWPCDGSGS